ncbi:MAG: TlpA family protein disulfide reductase [Flavobacteriales bacterium]
MEFNFRIKAALLLISGLLSLSSNAENCVITGTAIGSAGSSISISFDADPLSKKRTLLAAAEVSDDEQFTLNFDLQETRICYINVNRCEAIIYVRPGAVLNVVVPPKEQATFIRFNRTPIELELDLQNTDSLNLWIRAFNAEYAAFISNYFVDYALNHFGESKDQLRRLKDRDRKSDLFKSTERNQRDTLVSQDFSVLCSEFQSWVQAYFAIPMRDHFFHDYVTYSIGELESATGASRTIMYEKYLMSRQLPWYNPAFTVFLETFYNTAVDGQSDDVQFLLTRKVNIDHDPAAAIALLQADSVMKSSALAQAAFMMHLRSCYFKNRFTKQGIEFSLLEWPSEFPELKQAATHVHQSLRMKRDGWPVPNMALKDVKAENWELSYQKGSVTYIIFISLTNTSCLKELEFFRRWHKTFGKDIDFIAVSLDESFQEYRAYVQKHRDDKFPIYFGGDLPNLIDDLGLASLPFALLIDDQMNAGMAHTLLPSEGVERTLQEWSLRLQRNKK